FFFFQAEDGIRDFHVTGVQTCALPISVQEGRLAPSRLPACEGLALVSSVLGIVPVHKVDCLRLPSNARIAKIQSLVQSHFGFPRSEERRVGKECRSSWAQANEEAQDKL